MWCRIRRCRNERWFCPAWRTRHFWQIYPHKRSTFRRCRPHFWTAGPVRSIKRRWFCHGRHSCIERSSICHTFMFWHGNRRPHPSFAGRHLSLRWTRFLPHARETLCETGYSLSQSPLTCLGCWIRAANRNLGLAKQHSWLRILRRPAKASF